MTKIVIFVGTRFFVTLQLVTTTSLLKKNCESTISGALAFVGDFD